MVSRGRGPIFSPSSVVSQKLSRSDAIAHKVFCTSQPLLLHLGPFLSFIFFLNEKTLCFFSFACFDLVSAKSLPFFYVYVFFFLHFIYVSIDFGFLIRCLCLSLLLRTEEADLDYLQLILSWFLVEKALIDKFLSHLF